jgi:hypothetical protein
LRWAREGEAPGGGILWWNVDDIYRAAFPMDADKSMDEAREFALSAMRCGRGEDADMLLERHLCRKEAEMSIIHRSIKPHLDPQLTGQIAHLNTLNTRGRYTRCT